MTRSEMDAREAREAMLVRAVLVRRLKQLNKSVVTSVMTSTEFYWALLRENERGGN